MKNKPALKKGTANLMVKLYENKTFKATFSNVAETLNELGHRTEKGDEFSAASVRARYNAIKKEKNGK